MREEGFTDLREICNPRIACGNLNNLKIGHAVDQLAIGHGESLLHLIPDSIDLHNLYS